MLYRAPLLWLAISYISGEVLNKYVSSSISIMLIISVAIYLGISYITSKKYLKTPALLNDSEVMKVSITKILLSCCILFFIIGSIRYGERVAELNKSIPLLKNKIYSAKFEILDAPKNYLNGTKSGSWQTRATILSINNKRPDCDTEVMLKGRGNSDFLRGDKISAKYILDLPMSQSEYPQAFSFRRYLHIKGIKANLKILGNYHITRANTTSILRLAEDIRAMAIQNTLHFASPETKGFLTAAIFGYRNDLDNPTKNSFRETGIGHILAISGLHVGLMILLTNFLCKRLHLSPRKTATITIIVCIIFLLLSGGRSAVLRASIVAFIYLGGVLIFRRGSFINSLGAAALIICIANPLQIHDIGFQLSFISVVFISLLSHMFIKKLQSLRPKNSLRKNPYRYFIHSLPYNVTLLILVTSAAWLGVFPLTAYFFKEVSLIGFLTNILVIPLMPFTIAGGLLLELAPLLPSKIIPMYTALCCIPAESILYISKTFAKLPVTSINLFSPSALQVSTYYLLFFTFFTIQSYSKSKKIYEYTIVGLIILTISSIFYTGRKESSTLDQEIAIIRSRNGESAIISGETTMTNTGTDNEQKYPYTFLIIQEDAYPNEIIYYLYQRHIRSVDKLIYIHKRKGLNKDYINKLNIGEVVLINEKNKTGETRIILNEEASIIMTRSSSGRINWYNYKNNEIDILISNWQKRKLFKTYVNTRYPGYNAPVQILRIYGSSPLSEIPRGSQRSRQFILRDKDLAENPGRKNYGVIEIGKKIIKGWNGSEYTQLYNMDN